jgi:glycosyltransferase involved in cell wall biosynthesis
MLHRIRIWDLRTIYGVDQFIAISIFISRRISKLYKRNSIVIYPPVDVEAFKLCSEKGNFYLTASRMVPYKKIDLIVESFKLMPNRQLIVIGDGPDFEKIKSHAGKNVTLLGYQPYEVLVDYMQKAKAFIFAAEEDFGIAPLEAQACGTPVIAYGKGGALETIIDSSVNRTGIFFHQQNANSLCGAVDRFEGLNIKINSEDCRENALRFSIINFQLQFKSLVEEALQRFDSGIYINDDTISKKFN